MKSYLSKLLIFVALLSSCARNNDEVWEDTKSATRHLTRGLMVLGGKQGDSRQVWSRDEFFAQGDDEIDFIPIPKEDSVSFAVKDIKPKRLAKAKVAEQPPEVQSFDDPTRRKELAAVFKRIHFPLNSAQVSGENNVVAVRSIAGYMKKHPKTFIFIEGHCDERGAEAYNLALGSRRSNAVRNQLIQEGVNPDHLLTVSYGKEKPLLKGHTEDAWRQNRRAEFKIYQK